MPGVAFETLEPRRLLALTVGIDATVSALNETTAIEITLLDAPTNFRQLTGKTLPTFAWNAVAGEDGGYRVFRGSSATSLAKLYDNADLDFEDRAPNASQTWYAVAALDAGRHGSITEGQHSAAINIGAVVEPPPPPPPDPTPTPTPTTSSIHLGFAPTMVGVAAHFDVYANIVGHERDTRVAWDYGDGSRGWEGWNSAHVYDAPGLFTVTATLTRWNPTTFQYDIAAGKLTRTVNVPADTRTVIYVSPTGDDSHDGKSAAGAVKTIARLESLLGTKSNVNVLFQGGATTTVPETIQVRGSNVRFASYGTGQAKLYGTAAGGSMFDILDVAYSGITFDALGVSSKYTVGNRPSNGVVPLSFLKARGKAVTIRGCTFENFDKGFAGVATPNNASFVLLEGNAVPSITGLSSNFAWGPGNDYCIFGNTVANSTREHIVRLPSTNRVAICGNDFANVDSDGAGPDYNKKCVVLQSGSYCYAAGNKFASGMFDVSTDTTPNSTEGTTLRGAESAWKVTLLVGNDLTTHVNVCHNSDGTSIRRNIFHVDASAVYISQNDYLVDTGQVPDRPTMNVDAQGNARYHPNGTGKYGVFVADPNHEARGLVVAGNVDH